MLSPYGKNEWLTIAAIGLLLSVASLILNLGWLILILISSLLIRMTYQWKVDKKAIARKRAKPEVQGDRKYWLDELELDWRVVFVPTQGMQHAMQRSLHTAQSAPDHSTHLG